MNAKQLIQQHKIPCGPMSVGIEGICRRRLRDHYDVMLDNLTQDTHPEGAAKEILEMEEKVDIPGLDEIKESKEEKKKRLIEEGKLRAEVSKEVKKYKDKIMGNSKLLQNTSGKINKR